MMDNPLRSEYSYSQPTAMNDDHRPDPDALLAQLQREAGQDQRGKLYILLGMCPGVGKTYAMLLLARQRQAEGLNVLVGVVETHGREDTAKLLAELPMLPRRQLEHGEHSLAEFDLDAALEQAYAQQQINTRKPGFGTLLKEKYKFIK